MAIDSDIKDAPRYHSKHGDEISLNQFLSDCEKGYLTNSHGIVGEILLENTVIAEGAFNASDICEQKNREMLTNLEADLGTLYVVWYDN